MTRLVKTHYVTLRLVFDTPVPKREAYRLASNQFQGKVYDLPRYGAFKSLWFKVMAVIGADKAGVA